MVSGLHFVFTVPVGPGNYDRLEATLASLAVQKERVSIAFCHAGSKADLESIIAPYRGLFAYERHGPDGGQSKAINEGWRATKGDVYGWLNADDTLAPDALGDVATLFQTRQDVDIVCGQSLISDERLHITGLHPAVKAPDEDLFRSNIISQPSCFIRREALVEMDYVQEDLHYTMDWDLWVRLMDAGKTFAFLPDNLSSVLWDRDTKTGTLGWRRLNEIRNVVAKRRKPITTLKTLIGFSLHHLAEYTVFGHAIKRFRSFLRSGRLQKLTYWGEPTSRNKVEFDLFHYDKVTYPGLTVKFLRPAQYCVQVDGIETRSSGQEVEVPVSIPPGRTLKVCVSGDVLSPSDIDTISFNSTQTLGSETKRPNEPNRATR